MVLKTLLRNMVSKPMTVRFPYEKLETAERYRGEHAFDIDKCISCGVCERVCPNKAIEMVPSKDKEKYSKKYPKIDLGKCCFCGLCQEFCPKGAIKLTKNYFLATFDSTSLIYAPDKNYKED